MTTCPIDRKTIGEKVQKHTKKLIAQVLGKPVPARRSRKRLGEISHVGDHLSALLQVVLARIPRRVIGV